MGRHVPAKTEALGMKTGILTTWKVETEAQRGVAHTCVHTYTTLKVTLGAAERSIWAFLFNK